MSHTKKLIEVALPLDIINDASAYDKMPGIWAHPKGVSIPKFQTLQKCNIFRLSYEKKQV